MRCDSIVLSSNIKQKYQQSVSRVTLHHSHKSEDRKQKISKVMSARFSFHKKISKSNSIFLTIGWKTFKILIEWQYWHSFSLSLSLLIYFILYVQLFRFYFTTMLQWLSILLGVKIAGTRLQFYEREKQSERFQFPLFNKISLFFFF